MVQPSILPPLVRGEWVPMTWEVFLAWSSEEGKFEWVDGQGIALPPASTRHARTVRLLGLPLNRFVLLADLGRVREYWFDGPASLVVEVVSEDSVDRDLCEKRNEYEQAGVLEYLMVDARSGQASCTFLRLDTDGRYQVVELDGAGRYQSLALPGS